MNLITLNFCGTTLHASRDAWFNATEIAAMFGKRPIDWLRLPDTERYLAALCQREAEKRGKIEVRKSHFVKTKKGGYLKDCNSSVQGTWLHPKLAVAFARWLSPDFAVWCDEQIENLLHEHQQWQPVRHELKSITKLKNRLLHDQRAADGKNTQSHYYCNEAMLEYEALTGKRGIISRDLLNTDQIAALDAITAENAAMIAQGWSYQKRKPCLLAFGQNLNRQRLQAA